MHNVDGVAIGSCMLRVLRKARFRVCRDEGYFLSDSGRGDSETRCTGVETERRGDDGFGGPFMAVAVGESTMIVIGDEGTVGSPMGGGRRLALDRGMKLDIRKAVLCTEADGGTQLDDRSLSRSSSGDVVEEDDSSAFFSLSKPPPTPRSSASSSCSTKFSLSMLPLVRQLAREAVRLRGA